MTSLFRSPEDRERIADWHHRFRSSLPAEVASRSVTTGVGDTHVLVGGPEGAPPLVLLHGALASSAHVLHELAGLLRSFRVYAVDVVGQSVMSAEASLPVDDDSYGDWLREVMDGLGLERAHLVGVSWGGFVAQRLAASAPERIARLVLLVPAGVVAGPAWAGFWKIGLPMMLYRSFPSEARLRRLLQHLVSTPEDPLWTPFLGDAFLAYRLDMRVPARTRDGELAELEAPTLVIAADGDLSFPGEPLLRRAATIFPNLEETELLEGSRHCPPTTDELRAWLSDRITRFLGDRAPDGVPAPVGASSG